MSSTNKTANYKLSQWLPGDALSHEDVNADNAKIDAAIKSAADAASAHELRRRLNAVLQNTGGHLYRHRYVQHQFQKHAYLRLHAEARDRARGLKAAYASSDTIFPQGGG
jgi:hypothetical protein